ncbi:MAG TPA: hypothetical protein VNG12_24925, partial [Acidimicrobiales bacterium]|nr:hypothetical protein [Acidimicrobiales bacterium]
MEVFAYASWSAGHASSRSRRGSEPVTPGFRLRRLKERVTCQSQGTTLVASNMGPPRAHSGPAGEMITAAR